MPYQQALFSNPRCYGAHVAISMLLAARRRVEQQSTSNRNALNSVVRQLDLGIDARETLSDKQVIEISNWRVREHDIVEQRVARGEAVDCRIAVEGTSVLATGYRCSANPVLLVTYH